MKSFLKALAIWLLFTEGSAFALFVHDADWPLNRTRWLGLLEFFLVTFACAILLRLLLRFLKSARAGALTGFAVGSGVPILCGAALFATTSGFDSLALLVVGLMFSVPNAIGGALAGWIQTKASIASREGSSAA